jgi:hypothetical protein
MAAPQAAQTWGEADMGADLVRTRHGPATEADTSIGQGEQDHNTDCGRVPAGTTVELPPTAPGQIPASRDACASCGGSGTVALRGGDDQREADWLSPSDQEGAAMTRRFDVSGPGGEATVDIDGNIMRVTLLEWGHAEFAHTVEIPEGLRGVMLTLEGFRLTRASSSTSMTMGNRTTWSQSSRCSTPPMAVGWCGVSSRLERCYLGDVSEESRRVARRHRPA